MHNRRISRNEELKIEVRSFLNTSTNHDRKLTALHSGPELLPLLLGASMPVVPLAVSAETVATVVIVVTAVTVLLVAAPPALLPVPAVATTLLARKIVASATTTVATAPAALRIASARETVTLETATTTASVIPSAMMTANARNALVRTVKTATEKSVKSAKNASPTVKSPRVRIERLDHAMQLLTWCHRTRCRVPSCRRSPRRP